MKSAEKKSPAADDWIARLATGLPVIPLRDVVLFPGTVTPVLLARPQSNNALLKALEDPSPLAFFCLQQTASDEDASPESLKAVGVAGRVVSSMALPNGLSKILVESLGAARVLEWTPVAAPPHLAARLEPIGDWAGFAPKGGRNARNGGGARKLETVRTQFGEYLAQNPDLPKAMADMVDGMARPEEKLYAMAGQLKIPMALKQALLESPSLEKKWALAEELFRNEAENAGLGRRLELEVRAGVARNQRDYFLTEHLRKIQLELGSSPAPVNPEGKQLEEEAKAKGMPDKILERVRAEIRRLDYVNPSSPEYSVVRTYVDWFLALPWNRFTEDNLDIAAVKRKLDLDHFGLGPVKERILEHVAVFKLSRRQAVPILCLVGPPGTGKTSLGKSIAAALGREFVRISLGGVRDEAEIRGHRRTYIGSMPGRIVQALKKSGAMNPVILLDELDKMGSDFRGDPASALLEVLDPEQNREFADHFMEAGIDLSRIFFVTTANVEENIPLPLRDRLEVIRLPGYYDAEKLEIARGYLLPKIRELSGLDEKGFALDRETLAFVIRRYTREAGVRELSRQLSKLARKRARQIVQARKPEPLAVANLQAYLGAPLRREHLVPEDANPGVVTGLAWTPSGGEILRVECSLLSGKGRLHLTGNLGDVMKESAQIAVTLVRERAARYGVDPALFHRTDIHLHVPEGAIPKDGPSAGTAMTLALASAMLKRKVDPKIAFTGEVSLSGKIHAVGGLPEKVIAALQAGVLRVLVPAENLPEIGELPKEAKRGLKIVEVAHIDDLLGRLFKNKAGKKSAPGSKPPR